MRRQHGALTIITPLLMFLVILLGVMATDGARLYSLRQEMQSQVNAAATAAVNATQSCSSISGANSLVDIKAVAEQAAEDNGWNGEGLFRLEVGVLEPQSGGLVFRKTNLLQSNAVALQYQREVGISALLPDRFGTVTLTSSAAAKKEVLATVSAAGSTAIAGGDTGSATVLNALLGALFNGGNPYSFSPTDLSDLSEVTVRLEDLLDDTGVGGVVDRLPLDAEILANNLSEVLGTVSPAGRLLDDFLDSSVGLGGVSIEEVIRLTEDGASVSGDAEIPVYDLLISIALNVLEGTSVMLEDVGISIPGLAEVDASVEIFGAPNVVVAPARHDADGGWMGHVESADIAIRLDAMIDTNLTILGTGVRARIDLPLNVETGGGEVDLVRARCASGLSNNVIFGLAGRTALATIGGAADVNAQLELVFIPITLAGLRLNVDLPVSSTSFDVNTLPMQLNAVLPENIVEGGNLSVGEITEADISVEGSAYAEDFNCGLVCGTVNALLSPIISLLDGVLESALVGILGNLIDAVVNPILSALGLDLGVMEIEVSDARQGAVVLVTDLPGSVF